MTRPTVAFEVLRTGGAAVTTTVSVAWPMVRTGLKVRTPRALTTRLLLLLERAEARGFDAESVGSGRDGRDGEQASRRTRCAARRTLVALLIAMTVALGIAAPVESVTVPEMVPSPAVLRMERRMGW